MAIKNRDLKPGTVLTGHYHKVEHTCAVVESDGKLCFQVDDGAIFKSISAAGSAVTGQACNGWSFWSETDRIASDSQPAQTDTIKTGSKEANEADVDKKSVCRRNPNQKGVPQGQVRWHCYACRKSFLLPSAQVPAGCPGHPVS
jgi:hypothetical protein